MAPHLACGYVNGKNAFGALAGKTRFIYFNGSVQFDDESGKFARSWNTLCVTKLLSQPPAGAAGHKWGSAPTSDLRAFMPTTPDGLDLYVPKGAPAQFDGMAVNEEDFRYDRRRLYAVDLYLVGEANRDAMKANLVKRYGSPLSADDEAFAYSWKWPSRQIQVVMTYDASAQKTQVTFAHGSY